MLGKPLMRTLAGLIACVGATTTLAQPAPEWIRHYDSGERFSDAVEFMALGADGSLTVTGASDSEDVTDDIATIRYDADGNVLWTARYNGPSDGADPVSGVAVDAAGNAYVLGQTWGGYNHQGGGEWDYVLIKYDAAGVQRWVRQYDGPLHYSDTPKGIVVDADGNAYVCGYAYKERDVYDRLVTHFHVARFDTLGALAWEIFYDLSPHQGSGAEDIRFAPDGNLVITGIAEAPPQNSANDDVITMKATPDGQILWVRQWDSGGFNNGLDRPLRVRTDRDGNVYALAQFMSDDLDRHLDGILIRYAPDGALDWAVNTGLDNPDALFEMVDDEFGNVYLAGGWDNRTDLDGMVLSLDAGGNERWRVFYDGAGGFDYQFANTVMLGPDGNLYVGLDYQWPDAAGYDFTISVLDPQGAALDLWRYDTGSNSDTFPWVDGYLMDPQGNIYVGGYSWFDLTRADFTVLKIPTGGGQPRDGDLDGDGDVDLADLSVMLAAFGACGGEPSFVAAADIDGSGCVELVDLSALLAHYGS